MNTLNIFDEDWRACLRAHYSHVVKEHDENNEASLRTVLIQTGFTEEDIAAMRDEVLVELGWMPDESPAESPVESAIADTDAAAADEFVAPAETAPVEDKAFEPPAADVAEPEPAAPESSASPNELPTDQPDQKDEPPEPLVQMSLF